jgi:hypothetical protein
MQRLREALQSWWLKQNKAFELVIRQIEVFPDKFTGE